MNDPREALFEVQREIKVRQCVYPRLVAAGKLTQQEADSRMKRMQLAADLLADQSDSPELSESY